MVEKRTSEGLTVDGKSKETFYKNPAVEIGTQWALIIGGFAGAIASQPGWMKVVSAASIYVGLWIPAFWPSDWSKLRKAKSGFKIEIGKGGISVSGLEPGENETYFFPFPKEKDELKKSEN